MRLSGTLAHVHRGIVAEGRFALLDKYK